MIDFTINTVSLTLFVLGSIAIFWVVSLALYKTLYDSKHECDFEQLSKRIKRCKVCGETIWVKRPKQ